MESKTVDLSVFGMSPLTFKRLDKKQRKIQLAGRTKEQLQKLCRNMNVSDQGHVAELCNRLLML